MPTDLRLIASPGTWIEGEAIRQLEHVATLPGMLRVVGMPDLQPGKGTPVGAVFASEGLIYPALVGNDIGCGMGLWMTDLPRRKLRVERAVSRLEGLADGWDGPDENWLGAHGIPATGFERALGTVGGGNHFAEVQAVEEVRDAAAFAALGLDADRVLLLVHSGSRGLGHQILTSALVRHGAAGVEAGSADGRLYLDAHDGAVQWAKANRASIAERVLERLRAGADRVLDVCHNSVTPAALDGRACWLHRKGAAPADRGPVVIAGSRGAFTFLVRPSGDGAANLLSLAHGAGRRWRRGEARGRLSRRYRPEQLRRTALGGHVICDDRELLYDEAPEAYKDIETVVADLTAAGLLEVIAVLRPLITYKKGPQ